MNQKVVVDGIKNLPTFYINSFIKVWLTNEIVRYLKCATYWLYIYNHIIYTFVYNHTQYERIPPSS